MVLLRYLQERHSLLASLVRFAAESRTTQRRDLIGGSAQLLRPPRLWGESPFLQGKTRVEM
jgi:hypothetical protein